MSRLIGTHSFRVSSEVSMEKQVTAAKKRYETMGYSTVVHNHPYNNHPYIDGDYECNEGCFVVGEGEVEEDKVE